MNRYNYYRPAPHIRLFSMPALRAPEVKLGAMVFCATMLLIVAVGLVEWQRLRGLDSRLAAITLERDRISATNRLYARTTSRLAALQRMRAEVRAARDASSAHLNDMAALGNRLPTNTWLTSVRTDRSGSWAIEGRSEHLTEIGSTLTSLQRMDPRALVRLTTVATTGISERVYQFHIAWQRPT